MVGHRGTSPSRELSSLSVEVHGAPYQCSGRVVLFCYLKLARLFC
jgi:hypothetical protein